MKYNILILLIIPSILDCQSLVADREFRTSLSPGYEVILYAQHDCEECYYYLPSNLHLSLKNKEPEISLVSWDKSEKTEAGAILHFLIKWELSQKQQYAIQKKIENTIQKPAVVMGPVSVNGKKLVSYFYGDDEIVNLLNSNISNMPLSPTTPGSKMAFSFRFNGDDVNELKQMIDDIKSSKSFLKLAYSYEIIQRNGVNKTIE